MVLFFKHTLKFIDWVRHSSYNVFPIGVNDPHDGERKFIKNPEDEIASPLGWHKLSKTGEMFDTTKGNNVYAQVRFRSKQKFYIFCRTIHQEDRDGN